jgi:hypothetical protein
MNSWEPADADGDEITYSVGQEQRYLLVLHTDRAFATLFEGPTQDSRELAHAQVLSAKDLAEILGSNGFSPSDAFEVASGVFGDATRRWREIDASP